MLCPRCSMHMPEGALVCARCGERTPGPTHLPFDTRPPGAGPRTARSLRREIPIDRRGRGVRAVGALAPMRVRPPAVEWSRGGQPERRSRVGHAEPAPEPAPASLPSAVYEAKTEPYWLEQPVSAPPAPEPLESVDFDEEEGVSERSLMGRRLLASVADGALVACAGIFAAMLGVALFGWSEVSGHFARGLDSVFDGLVVGRGLGALVVGFMLLAAFVVAVVGHALGGQTPGKRLLGLRVVDREGHSPSFGLSFWRGVAACLSVGLGGLGLALALFHPEGLTLHDHLVGTRVVDAEDEF